MDFSSQDFIIVVEIILCLLLPFLCPCWICLACCVHAPLCRDRNNPCKWFEWCPGYYDFDG